MAFYELYPETTEGKKAIHHAWKLMTKTIKSGKLPTFLLPTFDIQAIVSLVTRQPFDKPVKLASDQIKIIEELCSHFANRKLRGAQAWTREEILQLPNEEIDLCRALLIEQFDKSENFKEDITQYEANLDLMTLQVLARLPENASNLEKIREINRYIFQEMQFRFPPHSLWAKDIDVYTFLPSVLDSRQGVCLGVSILYLCMAQRLDLPLEIITPPGHIYIRYHQGDTLINIETTARGINPPSEIYLGINTRKLEQRNIREVIGLAFVNQASIYWQKEEYSRCIDLYEKALPYLSNYRLLKMFLGLNYLFVGRIAEGEELLRPLKTVTFDYAVAPETLPDDYLNGKVDIDGLKAVFFPVDETRESIVAKQEQLKNILNRFPEFRGGILQLAITYLQLGRAGEARQTLEQFHALDSGDPTVEYYLAFVCAERFDYKSAWKYLKRAEAVTATRDHHPKALRGLRNQLRTICPES
jgi:tetratricopeptide (TPR) repeat protein